MNNRVRYGKVSRAKRIRKGSELIEEKVPKNTLSTIRCGDLLCFGIARCNIDLDRFNKTTGKLIATNRATLATKERYVLDENEMRIHSSGLRGTVNLSNVKSLLNYFQNIDTELKPEYLK